MRKEYLKDILLRIYRNVLYIYHAQFVSQIISDNSLWNVNFKPQFALITNNQIG